MPGRVREVDAARRVAGVGGAAGRVGVARRGRQRSGGAVVARDRGARARLPGPRRHRARDDGGDGPGAGGRAAAARQRARRAARGLARARRLPPALGQLGARERRVVRGPRAGVGADACWPRAPTRGCRSARCAPAASCSSCAPTSCASRRPRRTSSSTGGSELGLDAADVDLLVARTEGWPAGLYLAALSLAGKEDKHGLVAAFDGASAHVVDFLSSEVLAAYPPEVQAFMLRTSVLERLCAPLCDAVLDLDGSGRTLDALARSNLFLIPLDDRRAVVPLPPPVRPAPARRAGAARARAGPGAAPPRVPVAPRGGHHRRGDPPRRRRPRLPRGRRADRRDVGALRQRRADLVGPGLDGSLPAPPAGGRPAAAAREGVAVRAARARAGDVGGGGAGARAGRARRGPAP